MIGIIGVGGVARYAHLPSYRANALRCSVLCDVNGDVCKAVAQEFGISVWTTDVDVLLSNTEVEIIDLVVPPNNRAPLIAKLAGAGKPVLVQKPFCVTVDEFAVLTRLMPRDMHWRLNLTGRHVSAWLKVKELLASGAVGTPLTCVITNQDWWDRERGRWDLTVKDYIVYEMLIHHLDLCMFWFGMPSRLTGRGGTHPRQRMKELNRATFLLEYDAGLTITEDWSLSEFSFANGHPFEGVTITGSDGALRATSERVEFAPFGGNSIEVWHRPRPGQSLPGNSLSVSWFPDSFGAAMVDFVAASRDPIAIASDRRHLEMLSKLTFDAAGALDSLSWKNCGPMASASIGVGEE
jgi:predicted dehydrogenase